MSMKRFLIAVAVALSCAAFTVLAAVPAGAQTCIGAGITVPLAQGTVGVGSVSVTNDASFLYVSFDTTGGWTMSQLDLAVAASLAGIPQSSGAPNLSQFPYRTQFNPAVAHYTFTIPLGSFTIGTTLYLAAHTAAKLPPSGSANAWGAGSAFAGSKPCGSCDGSGGGDDDGEHCGDDHHSCDGGDGEHHDEHDGLASGGGHGSSGTHYASGDHHESNHHESDQNDGDHQDGDHHDGDHHDGDHGGDDHDHEGGNGGSCGATYFTYVLNCNSPE
jgi:hypothetical protein